MDDSFTLLDPHDAQRFLKDLPAAARRKGEALLRIGAVLKLEVENPGLAYLAQVVDGKVHEVEVYYDSEEGWDGDCSCPQEVACGHVFAALSALLAEHRTATVRSLRSGAPRAAAAA